jgi:aspartyl aminopeptidase
MNNKLFDFISASPTPYHAVDTVKKALIEKGFQEIHENENWILEKNKNYLDSYILE